MLSKFHSQYGFTLVEVLVSMCIFSIVVTSLPAVFMSYLRYNTRTERKTQAIAAAQRVLDRYRVQDPSTMPASGSVSPEAINIDGNTYYVQVEICSTSTHCTSNNNRQIKVDVRNVDELLYSVQTVFTRLK